MYWSNNNTLMFILVRKVGIPIEKVDEMGKRRIGEKQVGTIGKETRLYRKVWTVQKSII